MTDTLLYGRRKLIEANERREAAGENLWSPVFERRARVRLRLVLLWAGGSNPESLARQILDLMAFQTGLEFGTAGIVPLHDLEGFMKDAEDWELPNAIEAAYSVLVQDAPHLLEEFQCAVNSILNEHRISFELVSGRMIEFESRELHREVVVPVVTLLGHRAGWDSVEDAYQHALCEVGENPGDSITDAARALQEALAMLGCTGNALGPLVRDARKKGILAPHDEKLGRGIEQILHWVGADRSEKGDAHRDTAPTSSDAWLSVHIVGALILRLTDGSRVDHGGTSAVGE